MLKLTNKYGSLKNIGVILLWLIVTLFRNFLLFDLLKYSSRLQIFINTNYFFTTTL